MGGSVGEVRQNSSWELIPIKLSPTFKKYRESIFNPTENEQSKVCRLILQEVSEGVLKENGNSSSHIIELKNQNREYHSNQIKYLEDEKKYLEKIESLINEESSLSHRIDALQSQCEGLQVELRNYQDVEEKYNDLKNQHDLLEGICRDLEKRVNEIETKKNDLEDKLSKSKLNLAIVEKQITVLENELALEQMKVQDLQGNVSQLQEQQLVAQANLMDLNNNIDSLTDVLHTEKAKVAQLETKADNLDTKANNLETKVGSLEQIIEIKCLALQESVAAFEALNDEANQLRKDLESNELESMKASSMPKLNDKMWNHLVMRHYRDSSRNIIFRISALIIGLFRYTIFKFFNLAEIEKQIKEASASSSTPVDFQNNLAQIEQPLFV